MREASAVAVMALAARARKARRNIVLAKRGAKTRCVEGARRRPARRPGALAPKDRFSQPQYLAQSREARQLDPMGGGDLHLGHCAGAFLGRGDPV